MQERVSRRSGDPEQLLGFKSKRFTGVNYGLTCLAGGALTALFYALLLGLGELTTSPLIDMFFRSWVPFATVFFTGWALAMLMVKYLKLRNERRTLAIAILPDDPDFVLTSATAKEMLRRLRDEAADPREFVLTDRLERALLNLSNLGSTAAVVECLNTQARNDDDYLSNSYTVLRGFLWAIPVLGFIGTVIGLSAAVGGFGAVVSGGAGLDELKASLGNVTVGLAVAFETTLIALLAALGVQLLMTMISAQEEAFLDECADFAHRNIISKLKSAVLAGESQH
ncbi:MAG: MotA/TolQ/ExbB proton channel family protein [Victivallaceae bacterium]|nr:MotA/TolQ/ExbB proton channel family protein [Victivallaceae bacterium]